MQFAHPPAVLPSTEYRRLQRLMVTMIGGRTAIASILRRKLGSVRPVSASQRAAGVAVSGSHVHFRIDGRRSQDRVLTWQPPQREDTVHLSLLSPRGLALLGLAAGDSVAYRTDGARTEFLEVDDVWNPERPETVRSTGAPPLRHPVAVEINASGAPF